MWNCKIWQGLGKDQNSYMYFLQLKADSVMIYFLKEQYAEWQYLNTSLLTEFTSICEN